MSRYTRDRWIKHLRQKKDAQHVRANADYMRSTEGFWPAHYLSQKDYVRTAIPKHVNDSGSEDLARVVGYYLAEGSLCVVKKRWTNQDGTAREVDCKRVEWTFGIQESAMASELAEAVERLGHTRPGVYPDPKNSRIQMCSNSAELHDWLLEHCGKYSGGKVLSLELMGWRPELQRLVLAKWLDGDGHWCSRNYFMRGTSVSRQMSMQLLLMAARCGMAGSLSSHQSKATHIMGRPLKKKRQRAYTLTFHTAADAHLLQGEMTKLPTVIPVRATSWTKSSEHMRHQPVGATCVCTRSSSQDVVRVENGFVYRRIRKVRVTYATLPVYDLTVEGDHGFQTAGIGVSNCRMPYDRCSVCDKKSRKQEDYCSHLRDNMLRYMPQLKKTAYAVNKDDLKFFDISKVGRRADRVATYIRYMFGDDMAKAASFGDRIITGADWAAMEFAGKRGLGSDMLRMFAPWESATLEKLAAAEAELRETGPEHLVAIRRGAPAGIPQSAILAFADQDLPSIGGELAKRAMLLDFKSFSSLVSGLSLEDLDADNGFRKVAMDELPGIFGSMMAAGGCECGDAASLVAPDEFGCALSQDKDMIDNIIHEVGDNLGMEEGRMVSRAAKSMDKAASVSVREPAGDGGDVAFFRGMLNAYGYYAVKAAHIAQGVSGVSPHILLRAVPAMNQPIG